MEEFLISVKDFLEPFSDIISYILIVAVGFVTQSVKGRILAAVEKSIVNTETAFAGIHDKSLAKKDFAVNEICSKYKFLPKSLVEKWIEDALDNFKHYAEKEAHKALDEVSDLIEGGFPNEKISD